MYILICNPLAGKGEASRKQQIVERILLEQQQACLSYTSQSAKDAQQFLTNQIDQQQIELVIVIGGDGTLHSILQVLIHHPIPLAFLPAGSGNDAARYFQMTADPITFTKQLADLQLEQVDVLSINGQYGLTVAGIGLDAAIANRANNAIYKKLFNRFGLGSLTYLFAAFIELMTYRSFQGQVITEEEFLEINSLLIACGNTQNYGGGLLICPTAHAKDGQLQTTILQDANRFQIIFRLLPSLLRGKQILHRKVHYLTTQQLTIHANRTVFYVIDGEVKQAQTIQVQIHPSAISLCLTKEDPI